MTAAVQTAAKKKGGKKDSSIFGRFAPRPPSKNMGFLKVPQHFLMGNCPPIKAECGGV